MKDFRATFVKRIDRTETVASFRFAPSEPIEFVPGQFLEVIFDENNRENRALNKYLSFSNSPGGHYFEVTKRLSKSEFSAHLGSLHEDDTVLFKGPLGNCIFKNEYKKIGFLIGGIGITPVISILEYIIEQKLSTDVCLLYSNRAEHDIAFKDELDSWQEEHASLHIMYMIEECRDSDTNCIVGVINKEVVIKNIPDWQERVMFVYGPPGMVSSVKNLCTELMCNKDMLKTENFAGY